MSELLNVHNTIPDLRLRLLLTVSALSLLAGTCAPLAAHAGDEDKPTVWVELGGQLERIDGTDGRFSAPFLTKAPTPAPFSPTSPLDAQRAPRFGVGGEGKITFEPKDENWVFSAAIRYGRSNGNKTVKHQTNNPRILSYGPNYPSYPPISLGISAAQFAKSFVKQSESHAVIDFQIGRDVGLGMLGRGSSAVVNFGVRFAQFQSRSNVTIYARPNVHQFNAFPFASSGGFPYLPGATFNEYKLLGNSSRSFHGIGPSLSFSASTPIAGGKETSELMIDWGANGSVLFGRQRASGSHETQASHYRGAVPVILPSLSPTYTSLYHIHQPFLRSRTVTVPNVGGFAAISLKFPNAKVSLGYRGDFFFGAIDTGMDIRKTADTSFHGPFATISIGLGG